MITFNLLSESDIDDMAKRDAQRPPRVVSNTATIAECGNRWLWREMGRYYKTAVYASRAVMRHVSVPTGGVWIQTINWETTSRAGSTVVRSFN